MREGQRNARCGRGTEWLTSRGQRRRGAGHEVPERRGAHRLAGGPFRHK